MPAGKSGSKFCSACALLAIACALALLAACGGPMFTEGATAAEVDAQGDAGEVLDGASHPAAADAPELVDGGAADVQGDALRDVVGASQDAGEASRALDAAADVSGDEPLEREADAPDAPPACNASACPTCIATYLPCCKSTGGCGCGFGSFGSCN